MDFHLNSAIKKKKKIYIHIPYFCLGTWKFKTKNQIILLSLGFCWRMLCCKSSKMAQSWKLVCHCLPCFLKVRWKFTQWKCINFSSKRKIFLAVTSYYNRHTSSLYHWQIRGTITYPVHWIIPRRALVQEHRGNTLDSADS